MGQIRGYKSMKKETISEKQLLNLIKQCPYKDINSLEIWERCTIYNDYCMNCLPECERMKRILNNTEIKTKDHGILSNNTI